MIPLHFCSVFFPTMQRQHEPRKQKNSASGNEQLFKTWEPEDEVADQCLFVIDKDGNLNEQALARCQEASWGAIHQFEEHSY
mmetsp:Transcript_49749/g.113002  ORF Transcript_49749/g.113002 Transcript_49749/m.113002 type:complete len:82 (+) Transcript_49749:429-674(+)